IILHDQFKKIYFSIKNNEIKNIRVNTFESYIAKYILENHFISKDSKKYNDIRDLIFSEEEEIEYKQKLESNQKLDKLKDHIKNFSLLNVHNRNRDYYLQYAMLYLLDCQYFGDDVQIKVYKYQTMEEQSLEIDSEKERIEYLKQIRSTDYGIVKKEFDKLKYVNGKLITYRTWSVQKDEYPNWKF